MTFDDYLPLAIFIKCTDLWHSKLLLWPVWSAWHCIIWLTIECHSNSTVCVVISSRILCEYCETAAASICSEWALDLFYYAADSLYCSSIVRFVSHNICVLYLLCAMSTSIVVYWYCCTFFGNNVTCGVSCACLYCCRKLLFEWSAFQHDCRVCYRLCFSVKIVYSCFCCK